MCLYRGGPQRLVTGRIGSIPRHLTHLTSFFRGLFLMPSGNYGGLKEDRVLSQALKGWMTAAIILNITAMVITAIVRGIVWQFLSQDTQNEINAARKKKNKKGKLSTSSFEGLTNIAKLFF